MEQPTQVVDRVLCSPRTHESYYFYINNGQKHISKNHRLYKFLLEILPTKQKEIYTMFQKRAPFILIVPTEEIIELFLNSSELIETEKSNIMHKGVQKAEQEIINNEHTADKEIETLSKMDIDYKQYF